MVGWSAIIVVIIDTFRPNSSWTGPIIEVIIECFRPDVSMTEPNNCTRHLFVLGPVLAGSTSIFDDVIK
jgi:hypothetical protein